MFILEGSDTQFTFHITEKTKSWQTSEVDLTVYDKILLEMRYPNGVVEYEWSLENDENSSSNTHSYVKFEILSEATKWKSWKIRCDIWWVKGAQKIRFNFDTIQWEVLSSVKVPDGLQTIGSWTD